jgi:hypothetical protein
MFGYLRHLYSWITRHKQDLSSVTLDDIFRHELSSINCRRQSLGRPTIDPSARRSVNNNLIGMSVSGGGVRAATVCLGIMQIFIKRGFFRQTYYLSSVSGGGYFAGAISNIYARGASIAAQPSTETNLIHSFFDDSRPTPVSLRAKKFSIFATTRVTCPLQVGDGLLPFRPSL